MSHCVPDFEMDEEYAIAIPTSSSSPSLINTGRPHKKHAAAGEEEIMELLWQNGQVVLQRQNQRSFKKSPNGDGGGGGGGGEGEGEAENPAQQLLQFTGREIRSLENENLISHHHQHHHQQQQQLFMQEDEMASWLHYPLDDSSFDRDLYSDLLYPPPPPSVPITTSTTTTPSTAPREIRSIVTEIRPLAPPPAAASLAMPPRPPIPPPPPPPSKRTDAIESAPRIQNFVHFSRLPKGRNESGGLSGSSKDARELTVVESNETPTVGPESRAADSTAQVSGGNVGCETRSCTATAGKSTTARDLTTACELTVTSSPGGSGSTASASAQAQEQEQPPPLPAAAVSKPSTSTADDRKRKGRETDETEGHSADNEIESADTKRQGHGSTATKRSRAAEVHNLSERRRRDRINEKMRALQELIPRCNKSDKASMLDEAIEYLKSLQLQVQMMSMGCGMLPMMYPGVQQYMPAMGMGMGMGMNMGMDMGISRPMMPYQALMPGSGMPNPAAAANMGPRFPVPAFHMQPVPVPETSRIQAPNQLDPMLNSLVAPNPNQPRIPNFVDPYQQFIGIHQAQIPLPQNQMAVQPNKPSSSRDVGNPENHQSG